MHNFKFHDSVDFTWLKPLCFQLILMADNADGVGDPSASVFIRVPPDDSGTALAIKEDARAEDKVRAQFVVASAKISRGRTWAPPEDGRRGAAVRCAAIAASKVARAAIGAFSCGKLGIVCSVPSVHFNACSP